MAKDSYTIGSNAYDFFIEPFLARVKLLTVRILLHKFKISPEPRFLEVACGTGTLSHLLAKNRFHVVALDKSYSMIRQAYNKIHKAGTGRITVIHGDASTMPFFAESFDAVIMQLGLHEMENTARIKSGHEMVRVAKKDAVFILFDFAPTHKWSFSKFVLTIIEFIAGIDHYRNGRRFLKQGGILSFLENLDLEIIKKRMFFHGNICLAVAKKR
ncbi:MAG: methyltransferase domain-containing protein [Thermodesulfobacteriota bacterium]|nr:methyltransferase domain-containing protein [Thermodesulfobacteriota bacterium]